MEIIERNINDIKPYPRNSKQHKESQIKKIAASINEFGWGQPIVIDKKGVIIVGHGRYLAAHLLGIDKLPTLELDLDEEKAKAYRLADNKLNESNWDMEIVIEELKGMSLEMIDLTGFDSNIILETKEDKPDFSRIGKPITEPGDLYELGEHKLICGDSCDSGTFVKLLGDKERPRLAFCDAPYSIDYSSSNFNYKRKGRKEGYDYGSDKFGGMGGRIFNDDKSPEEALKFYKDALKQIYDHTADDATLYWWFATRLTDINMQALQDTNFHWSQTVIWLKNSFIYSPGQLFHRIYEPCMVAWKNGKTHYQSRTFSTYSELWTTGGLKTFQDHLDVWYQKRDNTSKYIHPTQKPVQLAERALKRSSEKGDIVLDAFGGSGSTLIACDQLERKARLVELDPKYCDAIVTRYCQYKDDPTIIKNGKEIKWIMC